MDSEFDNMRTLHITTGTRSSCNGSRVRQSPVGNQKRNQGAAMSFPDPIPDSIPFPDPLQDPFPDNTEISTHKD